MSSWNPSHDVRTAMKHLSIDPVIVRSVCCPKCFASYALDDIPEFCTWRVRRRCRPCGEPLTATRSTRSQGPITVPRRLYSVQSFRSWLEWFLSRPDIEDLLEQSWAHQPSDDSMRSTWDSPAWRSLGNFSTTRGNLMFSLFYDSFNPLHNKIAGKVVSCGVLTLRCMNLPFDVSRRPENTFFIALTPLPYGPNVVTITALLDPIMDQVLPFWIAQLIQTYKFPLGRSIRAGIVPVIADILASKKALGYGSHACEQFCSYCLCTLDQLERLDLENWTIRTSDAVRAAAENWTAAQTVKKREELFKSSGVRGSALHRLHYRDHVRHTIIGVMHNWMEGILQHHCRVKWGLGSKALPGSGDDGASDSEEPTLATRSDPMDVDRQTHSASSDEGDVDTTPNTAWHPKGRRIPVAPTFDAADLQFIRARLARIVAPTWFERPPANLGVKSHGKLKAIAWMNLFAYCLPLILVELWGQRAESRARDSELLANFEQLVAATDIVCSYSTSNAAADAYTEHYIAYRRSLRELWPDSDSVPNHHYAMHNGDQLKFWGPLMLLSELPFESDIGILQDISTNFHYEDMDYTMLRQISRKARLTAEIETNPDFNRTDSSGASLASILLDERSTTTSHLHASATTSKKAARSPQKELTAVHYTTILEYLQTRGEHFRHCEEAGLTHTDPVLPPTGQSLSSLRQYGRNFNTRRTHEGNSLVVVRRPLGTQLRGFIEDVCCIDFDGGKRTFLILEPLEPVPDSLNPYLHFKGLACGVAYDRSMAARIVVEPSQLISHLVALRCPGGTFGIPEATIITRSLNQGRVPE
ncbi:hypothetical protein EXIGLDRAFT_626883 [Exidia glandulosa HHB12029]|uniref:Uncharacterized protein n=1 Tax=Exidia glandulosa HHB12029 TaxID=1314781 RepID=A0A165CIR2_EXIGL|nr:hypothetical protein EXIGLDRAFT_626883 [Exidia glandulosa HHB12029]